MTLQLRYEYDKKYVESIVQRTKKIIANLELQIQLRGFMTISSHFPTLP